MRKRVLLVTAVALVLGGLGYLVGHGLADPNAVDLSALRAPPDGFRAIDRVRELFPQTEHWFRIVATAEFEPGSGGRIVPRLETLTHPRVRWEDDAGHSVFSQFGQSFRDATRIGSGEDPDVWVDVIPLAGRDVQARLEDGLVVYENAYPATQVLYKSTPTHVDEYLLLESPDAPTRWRFRIRKGPGIARMRQAGNSVEAVDARGIPWMRGNRPFAVDREGTRVDGTIRVEGDELIAEIDVRDLTYPVLVDPDWKSTGDMAYGRFYHRTNLLPDGRVLATGGCSASTCSGDLTLPGCRSVVAAAEALDLGTRTFSRVDDGSVQRFFHIAESLPGGSVLVAGGCVSSDCTGVTDQAEILDVPSYSFREITHLPEAVAGMASARLMDGRILIAGGCTQTECTTTTAVFDPSDETFSTVTPMNEARGRATVTVLPGGRVLLAGGCTDIECGGVLGSAEVYDPEGDTWTPTTDLSVPRAGHWAARLPDGRVMIGGGCSEQTCGTVLRTTEIFDPSDLTFTAGPAELRRRVGAAAVRLPDGELLLNQGCASRSDCDLTNEVYNPDAETFRMVEEAVTPRAFQSTLYHPVEQMVIANGGCQPTTCSWWIETWDVSEMTPDGGTWDAGFHIVDSGPPLTGDAGIDAGDTGSGDGGGGCGCAIVGQRDRLPTIALALGLVWILLRRRRRSASRARRGGRLS